MEVIAGIILAILALGLIGFIMETVENWFGSINWTNFFLFFIIGSILLALIFSFTSEGVLVIIGAYIVLLLIALISGKFKKDILES